MKKSLCILSLGFLLLNCGVVALKGSGINQPVSLTSKIDNREYIVIRPNAVWSRTISSSQVADFDARMGILDLLAETPGDGIVNFRFRVYQNFISGCIEAFTVGLISTYTVEIRGDIVKYK